MKQISQLLAITFCLSIQIQAQTWTAHNAGFVNSVFAISFPTIDTGYAMNDVGQIRKTINGAVSWTGVSTPPTTIYSILFISGQVGFSFGDGLIYKTSNGGTSWAPVMNNSQVSWTNMYFSNTTIGYACAYKTTYDSICLYKTVNGGNNWSKIFSKPLILSPEQGLYFINPTKGFWAVNSSIFSTTTGGTSFNSVYVDITQSVSFMNFEFPNIDTGYALGNGAFFRSEDGGASWSTSAISLPGILMYDLHFFTGKKGFICGGNGMNSGWVQLSLDAGTTWAPSYTSPYTFYCMDFPSNSIGYVGGDNGTVLKYSGILTETSEYMSQHFLNIFPNPSTGYVTITNAIPGSKIMLLDLAGQIIREEIAENSTLEMNLENVAAGIYFIQMENAGGKSIQKIIVY